MLHFFPELGVYNILYASLIAHTGVLCLSALLTVAIFITSTAWVLKEKHRKKYGLFSRESWVWDQSFKDLFVVESGWMLGYNLSPLLFSNDYRRGMLDMGQYWFSPIIVSRLGPIHLSTYSVQNLLYFFTCIFSGEPPKVIS